MKNLFTLLGIIICLLIACDRNPKTDNESTGTINHRNAEVDGHTENAGVELNNGQKWNANAETTQGIRNMALLLEEFTAQPNVDDYHSLKIKLEKEFDSILQKCTMTGEAHNQLHNYLLPMKVMIENIDTNSTGERKKALEKLNLHLKEYNTYFQ